MTSPLTYIALLFKRASQKSVVLTDQLSVLIVPFATLVLWMAGAKMTETIQETLALGVAITVIAVVVLRLIASSYFVWKDDQSEKAALQRELDEPEREIAASLKSYTTDRRKQLSEKLARLSAICNYKTEALPRIGIGADDVNRLCLEIDTLVNQLSYDPPLRVAVLRLKEYCMSLITGESNDRERLWAQRKLTFQLIHKEDRIADFMTLVDLELLAGESWRSGNESDELEELKAMILALGDTYYDPAVVEDLKAKIRVNNAKPKGADRVRRLLQGTEAKKPQKTRRD